MLNTEWSGPDLGLAIGELDVKTFDLGAPFLSLSRSLSLSFMQLWTMHNLNYTPTNLGISSLREIISGGTQTKKFEYHWVRRYAD
jgi:hypothetical protein